MKNIISYYTKYTKHINEYKDWQRENVKKENTLSNPSVCDIELLRKKAKTISEPILLFDSYEHDKAEDSETFFQTYNIELMSITTVLATLPAAVLKTIPFLNKYSDNINIFKKLSNLLTKYKNTNISVFKRNISLPQILTTVSAIGSGIFYISNMKKSMESQLGLIRKASFDASQNLINNPNFFAIYTPEQEKQINSIVKYD